MQIWDTTGRGQGPHIVSGKRNNMFICAHKFQNPRGAQERVPKEGEQTKLGNDTATLGPAGRPAAGNAEKGLWVDTGQPAPRGSKQTGSACQLGPAHITPPGDPSRRSGWGRGGDRSAHGGSCEHLLPAGAALRRHSPHDRPSRRPHGHSTRRGASAYTAGSNQFPRDVSWKSVPVM